MTYTYKLARRLAVLRAAALAITVTLLASCGAEESTSPGESPLDSIARLSKVKITPDSLTLEPGQPSRFRAFRVVSGDTTSVLVRWSASGGQITSDGTFTSNTTGKFKVIGRTWSKRPASDTSIVLVVSPVADVVRVVLTPDTATVAPGASRTFTAQGMLSDSSLVAIGVDWSATGGQVDAGGVYTAGPTAGTYRIIAANADGTLADTAIITIPAREAPVPAQVFISPASATVAASGTKQFAAYGRNSNGDSVSVAVGYTGTGGTINSSGLYTAGTSAGTYRVIATQIGGTLADTAAVTVTVSSPPPPPPSGDHAGWQVGANGSSSGQGTSASPWSLSYALQGGGGRIRPGDTVWVRGGSYSLGDNANATVAGTASAPVIIRGYPGERATIDASINVFGAYVWYWGLELKQADAGWQNAMCFNVIAPGVRIINNVIHDCSGNGIGLWYQNSNGEATGNLLYNNGRYGGDATRYAHGIYFENNTGTKLIRQNAVLNTFSHAFHGWPGDDAANRDVTIEDNVALNAASFVGYGGREYLVAPGNVGPVERLTFRRNHALRMEGAAQTDIGYYDGGTNPAGNVVTDNYVTGELRVFRHTGITLTGNTVVSTGGDALSTIRDKGPGPWNWNGNNYYRNGQSEGNAFSTYTSDMGWAAWPSSTGFDAGSRYGTGKPSGQRISVIKNPYERGRALVVVWNWSGAGSATVDLSDVLTSGQAYEVRNAQRVWDAPALAGTYSGPISLSLSAVTPYAPVARAQRPAASTGTLFQVFLVLPR